MSWIVVVAWKNGTVSVMRVPGDESGPFQSDLFWSIDIEGDPHDCLKYVCKSTTNFRVGQDETKVWCSVDKDGLYTPLQQFEFDPKLDPYA